LGHISAFGERISQSLERLFALSPLSCFLSTLSPSVMHSQISPTLEMASSSPPAEGDGTQTRKRKRHCFTRSKAGCQVCRKQKKKVSHSVGIAR
jgi:hypothetical protein